MPMPYNASAAGAAPWQAACSSSSTAHGAASIRTDSRAGYPASLTHLAPDQARRAPRRRSPYWRGAASEPASGPLSAPGSEARPCGARTTCHTQRPCLALSRAAVVARQRGAKVQATQAAACAAAQRVHDGAGAEARRVAAQMQRAETRRVHLRPHRQPRVASAAAPQAADAQRGAYCCGVVHKRQDVAHARRVQLRRRRLHGARRRRPAAAPLRRARKEEEDATLRRRDPPDDAMSPTPQRRLRFFAGDGRGCLASSTACCILRSVRSLRFRLGLGLAAVCALQLAGDERAEGPALVGDELVVRPRLRHAAVRQHDDGVRVAHRGQPVRHQ